MTGCAGHAGAAWTLARCRAPGPGACCPSVLLPPGTGAGAAPASPRPAALSRVRLLLLPCPWDPAPGAAYCWHGVLLAACRELGAVGDLVWCLAIKGGGWSVQVKAGTVRWPRVKRCLWLTGNKAIIVWGGACLANPAGRVQWAACMQDPFC